jgi:hypothetical protein
VSHVPELKPGEYRIFSPGEDVPDWLLSIDDRSKVRSIRFTAKCLVHRLQDRSYTIRFREGEQTIFVDVEDGAHVTLNGGNGDGATWISVPEEKTWRWEVL